MKAILVTKQMITTSEYIEVRTSLIHGSGIYAKKDIPKDFGYLYYSFDGNILNKDPFLTKKYFNQFISKIYNDLNSLKKQKKRIRNFRA